jgi:hypothetical protein
MKQLRTRRAIVILAVAAVLLKHIERAPVFLFVIGLFFVHLSVADVQDFTVASVLP